MMMTVSMREKLARALAGFVASAEFDDLHRDKRHWIETRGEIGGQYHDINEPRQADLLAAADAVLDVLAEPDEGMLQAGVDNLFGAAHDDWSEDAYLIWQAMLKAARSPALVVPHVEGEGK